MARIFYSTFNRSREIFYDGCFIEYDDGKVVGYTHDGILTGTTSTKVVETDKDAYISFPVEEGFIEDRHQLIYDYDKDNIVIKLYEHAYSYEAEELVLERTWERANKLPVSVQIALEKFLESGETDT